MQESGERGVVVRAPIRIADAGAHRLVCDVHGGEVGIGVAEIGKGRHFISVTLDGKMIADRIVFREGEEQFVLTGGINLAPGVTILNESFDVEVEDLTAKVLNYHIQGPNSGKVVEKLCGEDISDLEFIHFRDVVICGERCVLYRGGMSGELGYEIFSDASFGSER